MTMKKIFIYLCLAGVFFAFRAQDPYRKVSNTCFQKGEHIEYLVHYGPINAGYATVDVSPKHYLLNSRVCYRVDVVGKTIGAAGVIAKVNDTWRTYIDTSAFIPHRFFRNIEEGNYRRKELTNFVPLSQQARMKYEEYNTKDKETGKPKRRGDTTVSVPNYVQDMVSGYYFLRTIDFDKLQVDEIITIPGILEDELYDFKIQYKGRDVTKTKFGKMNAHKLIPVMPKNGLFDGESSIRFWVSDDKNRIPIRIEADMFIGKVVCEVKKYDHLKHKFNFVKN